MTPDEVRLRVELESAGERERGALGVRLGEMLMSPIQVEVTEPILSDGSKRTVWLVGVDPVEASSGYQIVFCEEDGFGLACAGFRGELCAIGW